MCLTEGPRCPGVPGPPPCPTGPSGPAGPPSPRSPWIPAGPYMNRGIELNVMLPLTHWTRQQ